MYLRMHNGNTELVYEPYDFFEDLEVLVEKLSPENLHPLLNGRYFDGIYGVEEGGSVLRACLHYRLGLPSLLTPTRKSLIVDDIADSGKTLSHYAEKGIFIATLFYRKGSIVVPNVWLHEKETGTYSWVRFALWEGLEDKGV